MESWRKTLAQFRDLFNGMAPSQRMTLVVVPLLVLAALGFVMYSGIGPSYEPLLSGKTFTAEELNSAQQALQKGGLSQFRVDGQKILAPRADVGRYNAALIMNSGMPSRFGEDWEKALDKNPLMMGSDRQRQELVDVVRAREVVKMIREIPEVENASIVWHRSKPRGFSGDVRMSATLAITPRGEGELTGERYQSLQRAVAGAWGMKPEDVTVLNTRSGYTFKQPDSDDPYNSEFVDQNRKFTTLYQRKIADALAYITNALVTVNVELDPLVQSREQQRQHDPKAFPFRSVEQTDTETSSEARPSSEPGMVPNQPRSVRPQSTANTSRNTEKSLVSTDSVPTRTTVTDKVYAGMTPRSVQVAVAIPRDYYRAVAIKDGADEADKAAFQAKLAQIQSQVEKEVAPLIPLPTGTTAADLVNVSSYDRLDATETATALPMTAQLGDAVAQWGGPAGLAFFALWAFWMLNRSMKRSPSLSGGASAAAPRPSLAGQLSEMPEEPVAPEPTRRDRLQVLVRDNPEMAATVIGRWMSPAK
jgi:flagellar M-ring protein FliF